MEEKNGVDTQTERAARPIGRVVSDYRTPYPDPVTLKAGDVLTIGDQHSPWPGWIWCTDRDGKSAWVPESYVEREGNTGTMRRDYDATELSVRAGEELAIGEEESGWFWCTNQAGQSGWVPAEHVQVQPAENAR